LEDNINVVVRVRPVSEKEIKANDESVVQFPGNGQLLVSISVTSPLRHLSVLTRYDHNYSVRVKMTCINRNYLAITSYLSPVPLKRTFCSTVELSD
jgi:hypothetical protein